MGWGVACGIFGFACILAFESGVRSYHFSLSFPWFFPSLSFFHSPFQNPRVGMQEDVFQASGRGDEYSNRLSGVSSHMC